MTNEEVKAVFPEVNWAELETERCIGYQLPSYSTIVSKLAQEVVVESSDNDYQGSTFALLRDGERHGYLEFGWGSCSGCDALQGCDSVADFANLYEGLRDGVRWFESREAFLDWARSHDWGGEWSWHDGARGFVAALNEKLGAGIEAAR